MSQKIKRRAGPGTGTVRKAAAAQGKAAKARAMRRRTGSALDAVMAWVPLSDEALHRVFLVLILGGAAALVALVAGQAGVPALATQRVALVAADAGFEVHRVEVRGTQHLNELKVYERVLAQRDRAMTQVDLAALRGDLLRLSWVKDARVSRQLPDTLVIDIVERKPHAVLRAGDHLVLIDDTGAALDPISDADAKGMLVLSGTGVPGRVSALSSLLDAAPALKPQVAEAEWVGNRRWNIQFKTGQVLALPEGEQASADALVSFARLDGTNRLLGGRVVAFDMRAPDRIYLRLPGHTAASDAPHATATADGGATDGAAGFSAEGSGTAASGMAKAGAVAIGAASLAASTAAPAKSPHPAKPLHPPQSGHQALATLPITSAHEAKAAHAAKTSHQAKTGPEAKSAREQKSAHQEKSAHQGKAGETNKTATHTAIHAGGHTATHPMRSPMLRTASREAN